MITQVIPIDKLADLKVISFKLEEALQKAIDSLNEYERNFGEKSLEKVTLIDLYSFQVSLEKYNTIATTFNKDIPIPHMFLVTSVFSDELFNSIESNEKVLEVMDLLTSLHILLDNYLVTLSTKEL